MQVSETRDAASNKVMSRFGLEVNTRVRAFRARGQPRGIGSTSAFEGDEKIPVSCQCKVDTTSVTNLKGKTIREEVVEA